MRGYYLMHRGWLDHPVFGNRKREPFCRAAAWAWLIDDAAYEPRSVRVGSKVVELQRGQLTHSLRFLAQAWGWQHDRCRRFLNELSHVAMIATASATGDATGQLLITVCNYDKYQEVKNTRATGRATGRAVAVRQLCDSGATDSKEGNQGKEKESEIPKGGLGRSAPSRRDASAAGDQRDAVEQTRDADALTPAERAERIAILDRVKSALNGGKPKGNGIRDPAAYERAVGDTKRDAWLVALHAWVSERFDGEQRMLAWEAINAAKNAGSRDATPKPVRKLLDEIDKLRIAEQEAAA